MRLLFRAATITDTSQSLQRLFEGGYYSKCGVYSRKYDIHNMQRFATIHNPHTFKTVVYPVGGIELLSKFYVLRRSILRTLLGICRQKHSTKSYKNEKH